MALFDRIGSLCDDENAGNADSGNMGIPMYVIQHFRIGSARDGDTTYIAT